MIKRFLRLFKQYRELEKKAAFDSYFIESLIRHIGALEGKTKMQEELIQELRERLVALVPKK